MRVTFVSLYMHFTVRLSVYRVFLPYTTLCAVYVVQNSAQLLPEITFLLQFTCTENYKLFKVGEKVISVFFMFFKANLFI